MAGLVTLRTTRMKWLPLAKSVTPPVIWKVLYRSLIVRDAPDASLYDPHFSPWLAPDFVSLHKAISPYTVVSLQRCWTLWTMVQQAMHVDGDVMEAGVFQGGTAKLLRSALVQGKALYLFDSFEGMKKVSNVDRHLENDFADTSVEAVRNLVGSEPFIHYLKGWVPDTFAGLEHKQFCFAHIDLDLYKGVKDCIEFVYPRLSPGGIVVFDDYGYASCPGARQAVDEFFVDKPEMPLALSTGQMLAVKLP